MGGRSTPAYADSGCGLSSGAEPVRDPALAASEQHVRIRQAGGRNEPQSAEGNSRAGSSHLEATMRIAVLSDIHGNVWALDAVLAEVESAGVEQVLNLGDCFWGPLAPRETLKRLRERPWPTVRGNQDRVLLEGANGPMDRYTLGELGDEGVRWLIDRTSPAVAFGGVLACHGTPDRDDDTLVERVEETHVRQATTEELGRALDAVGSSVEVVLCGHSHRPAVLSAGDRHLVVNPGSVGLPAYRDDEPYPHGMEAGSPHARWALLERTVAGWRVQLRATPYDTSAAVIAARARGREDWARWIGTGRASSDLSE